MAMRWCTWGVALTLLASGLGASAGDFRILHAEAIAVGAEDLAASNAAAAAHAQAPLLIEAYGRQFALELEPNERLLSRLPAAQRAALARFPIYRGHIEGLAHSWVRLTRVGHGLHGMMWDGDELYVIEPRNSAEDFMIAPALGPQSDHVVYRLSDTQSGLGPNFCAVRRDGERSSALAAYQSLVAELRQSAALAAVPSREMQVAVLGDSEFVSDHPADPQGVALARMNSVDGIFSDQVGVQLSVATVRTFSSAADPFSDTTIANELIDEVGTYKNNAANGIRSTGVAHLMTGRDLDGNTVGIAFLESICSPLFGVSLSQGGSGIGSTSAVLVAAHEIGHNFGAPHDAEAGEACEGTPATFLMAAQLNGSDQFSQCSLEQMQPIIAAAQCITPLAFSDAALSVAPASVSAPVDQAVSFAVTVSSVGALQVDGAIVTITVPPAIAVDSAVPTAGSCSAGAGAITCDLGAVPASSSRRIDLSVRGTQEGSFVSSATVAATNDADTQNNAVDVTLTIGQSTIPPAGNGGGGGGAFGLVALLGLLLAAARRLAPGRVVSWRA
jgi:hypothetical protein